MTSTESTIALFKQAYAFRITEYDGWESIEYKEFNGGRGTSRD